MNNYALNSTYEEDISVTTGTELLSGPATVWERSKRMAPSCYPGEVDEFNRNQISRCRPGGAGIPGVAAHSERTSRGDEAPSPGGTSLRIRVPSP